MNSKDYFMEPYQKVLKALGIPVSTDYERPEELRVRSIMIGNRRFAIESPADYIARMQQLNKEQKAAKPVRRRRNRVTSDPAAETAMPMAASSS